MKNLVLNDKFVEQGMQVHFKHGDCFVEEEGSRIARGCREGWMFILDSHEIKLAMFAKGLDV